MKLLKCVYESGVLALPIMFVAGCIVWVLLCEALFQLGMLPWWF